MPSEGDISLAEQKFNLTVDGMICVSCALLTDGIVIEGVSTVDESMVTGESMPVVKEPGHRLAGGCINANSVLKMRVTAVGADTFLANIIHMVDQA